MNFWKRNFGQKFLLKTLVCFALFMTWTSRVSARVSPWDQLHNCSLKSLLSTFYKIWMGSKMCTSELFTLWCSSIYISNNSSHFFRYWVFLPIHIYVYIYIESANIWMYMYEYIESECERFHFDSIFIHNRISV